MRVREKMKADKGWEKDHAFVLAVLSIFLQVLSKDLVLWFFVESCEWVVGGGLWPACFCKAIKVERVTHVLSLNSRRLIDEL